MTRIVLKLMVLAAIFEIFGMNIAFSAENKVVTTIYPVYVVVKEVGDSVCDVENLVSAGANPHDYQIKPGDLAKLQNATLVFTCGLGLDNWFDDVISKTMGSKKTQTVLITKGLENSLIYDAVSDNRGNSKTANPHFWLDPILMKHAATNAALRLKEIFPDRGGKININLKIFSEKMDELDRFIEEQFSNVKKRPIICLHNAFAYFAERYGIEVVGVIEEVHDFPVSPQRLAKLMSIAKAKSVCVIFGETGSSNELARRLADELKVPFTTLDTLESTDEKGANYVERMKMNALAIKKYMSTN
ncbi:MAG: metal ABC transporter substrate-binding protein [Verrucomicrobiae bacterium]|nr:metal ABC transporter substrate-binding protein [Verrucomicrobiae bacterium]